MGSVLTYYRPIRIALSDKPAKKLVKEPEYLSKNPLYGTMQLGDGPDNQIAVVVDETEDKQRIYIDRSGDRRGQPGHAARAGGQSGRRRNAGIPARF
jgi:hypothetical protein